MASSGRFMFAREAARAPRRARKPWKVLIADDENDVHRVTKLALDNFVLDDRPLRFVDVYTGRDAVEAIAKHPDTALVLMDVVMENDHAGLDAINAIREKLGNKTVRIVVRTGHAGRAPELQVLTHYDINDYKEKTELTAKKLFTTVYTSLTLFQDLNRTKKSREALDRILGASTTILRRKMPERLARGALQLLTSVLGVNHADPAFGALMVMGGGGSAPRVFAGVGRYKELVGKAADTPATAKALEQILAVQNGKPWVLSPRTFAARIAGAKNAWLGIYLEAGIDIAEIDDHVLDVLCHSVDTALQVAQLNRELFKQQYELIVMLSEAIERRSKETGNHVRRVGEYSRLLANLAGLPEDEADQLLIAAALHDAGKIAIPDAILTKPGALTPQERAVMETHAQVGADMFAGKELAVLKAAMTIAGQHHERWDGLGYPGRLHGEGIHIYGRIVALADVFDALDSHRCYKSAWPMEDVIKTLRLEKGRHFDPRLVDLLLENFDQFLAIRERFADP